MSRNSGGISLKRIKIDQANSRMFIAVAVAASITSICLVALSFLWDLRGFNNRVIAERKNTLDIVETNVVNADQLVESFDELEASNVNSITVLDALPPLLDFPSIPVAIENLAERSNVELTAFSGVDNSDSAETESFEPIPVEVPLTLEVNGQYTDIQEFIRNMELVIRPIQLTGVEYAGTNTNMNAAISVVTYYQPATLVELDSVQEVR